MHVSVMNKKKIIIYRSIDVQLEKYKTFILFFYNRRQPYLFMIKVLGRQDLIQVSSLKIPLKTQVGMVLGYDFLTIIDKTIHKQRLLDK